MELLDEKLGPLLLQFPYLSREVMPSGNMEFAVLAALQWGRDLSIAEIDAQVQAHLAQLPGFNGAAISRSRKSPGVRK